MPDHTIDPDKLAERLAKLDENFKAAPSAGPGDFPEDGTYDAVLDEWRFAETKDKHAALLVMSVQVVHDPKYAGWKVDKLWNLEPNVQDPSLDAEEVRMRLGFLKRDLKRFGIDVDGPEFALSDVRPGSPILEDQLDRTVEIVVKTKGDYTNVYINHVGDKVPGGAKALATPPSDIPSDLPQQALPGADVPERQPASAIGDDDDIPF